MDLVGLSYTFKLTRKIVRLSAGAQSGCQKDEFHPEKKTVEDKKKQKTNHFTNMSTADVSIVDCLYSMNTCYRNLH